MNNLSIIVAIAKNNGIGKDNQLLYWLPNDLKRLKALPTGHTVIMGGASVYKEALPLTHRLYITLVHDTDKQADAFFPEIDEKVWKETSREDHHTDEKHLYPYSFINYERR